MNKRYSIVLAVSFFAISSAAGIALAVNGSLPFDDAFLALSANVKNALYLPTAENHAIIEGTFDINIHADTESGEKAPAPVAPTENAQIENAPIQPAPAENAPVKNAAVQKEADLDLSNSTGYLIIGDKLMQMCTTYSDNLAIYANNLNRLKSRLPDKTVIAMVAPNSFPFYAPAQYMTPDVDQKAMINNLYAKMDPGVKTVDVFSVLEKHQEDYNYFRIDHHWTARGAYRGYTAFCDTMGIEPTPLPDKPSGVMEDFVGITYKTLQQYPQAQAALKNPDYIEYYIPETAYTAYYYNDASMQNGQPMKVIQPNLSAVDDKYLVFLEGLRPVIHINTEVKNGRSILIIKDSYANAFVPFLLGNYQDIYVVDFRNFNKPELPTFNAVNFVNDNDIDEVMITNYPYVPNGKEFSEWIGKMIA